MLRSIVPFGSAVCSRYPACGPLKFWKYHHGRPFCSGTTVGLVTEKRPHLRRDGFEDIGFQRQEHQVLLAGFLTARHRAHVARELFAAVVMEELEPVRADGFQMRTLVDYRDGLPGKRKPDGEHAADRTCADHCDSHKILLCCELTSACSIDAARPARPRSLDARVAYSKRLVSVPMPSMTTLTVLPGFIEPTPTDVPQAMTSPASSVMSCEIRLASFAGGKMISATG